MTAADQEELRRRLYRPGADGTDVDAYRSTTPDAQESERVADPGAPRWGRGRAPLLGAAAVVALVVLLGVVRAAGAPAPDRRAARSDAGVLPVAVAPLPTAAVDAPTRFVLVRNLLGDHDAGLGTWLDHRPGSTGVPRDRFVETHGSGDAVVTIPGAAADGAGRLTVLLVLAQDGAAGWSAGRLVLHEDRTVHLERTAERFGALRAGVPAVGRLAFGSGSRPVRLLVSAPDDVEWGVAAVLGP